MVKVITYGTFDLLHEGHYRLLQRAKALGDYLVVGVTSDDYDKSRGKINVKQSLMERIEAVKSTGFADEVIVEEYEGQKIEDIRRMEIDIFTVGSDWTGKFDYLNEYCQVLYLPRTEGISSSQLRAEKQKLKLGIVGNGNVSDKFEKECAFVSGVEVIRIGAGAESQCGSGRGTSVEKAGNCQPGSEKDAYDELLKQCDAVYIASHPTRHYEEIRKALEAGKHVLSESPSVLSRDSFEELRALADEKGLIFMEAVKTAYSTAYARLLLLVKSGRIGEIVSVDAACTSLHDRETDEKLPREQRWNSLTAWGPVALLPVFDLLGADYVSKEIVTRISDRETLFDDFTRISFIYPNAVASVKVAKGAKSEGELIITGTKGYIYVPAPWWKTDYFEVRYENQEENRRHFYELSGEGIRYEIVAFLKAVESGKLPVELSPEIAAAIVGVTEDFFSGRDVTEI